MAQLLTDLPAGHRFDRLTIALDPTRAAAYREAAGDKLDVYEREAVVPPLAVPALCLGALLETVSLPPGTLHASERVEFRKPVPAGASVDCDTVLSQRSQRSGWIVSVIDSQVMLSGEVAVQARATLLSPISQ